MRIAVVWVAAVMFFIAVSMFLYTIVVTREDIGGKDA